MNNKRPSKPFNEECHMWESSMPYICSTLSIRWSRRSSACACAWEEGCVVSFGTEVKCSISSSVSPSSSATLSLGIWETLTDDSGIWALFQVMVCALIGSSLCITWSPLGIVTLALVIRDMTRLGNYRVNFEFLFVMHLVKRWYMWLQMSISLCVKRSNRNMDLGADKFVKFLTR